MLALNVFAHLVAADTAPKIMLVLALLVSIFGIYVVVSSRRNRAAINHVTRDETSNEDLSVRDRISKTRSSFAGAISVALTRSSITQQTWDELEEALLRADVGVTTTTRVLAPLRELVKSKKNCSTE
ncbi:MAG: signal recognition particle receptor subunit alpha [Actinobacteria bacterium]|nr:signal recognition particle receptor subunit alpha [Actinomycetota bacterium]